VRLLEEIPLSTLLIVLSLFAGGYLASALSLWLGARWFKVERATLQRALVATLFIWLLSISLHFFFQRLQSAVAAQSLLALGVELCAGLLVTWLAITVIFRTTFWRAIGTWLPTLVPNFALVALIQLILVPHVVAAFIVPTYSMAPTLLGPHQKGICPHCGQVATLYYNPEFPPLADTAKLGMCKSCQKAGIVIDVAPEIFEADRFLVNKLLTPRRWDLVVFRSLQDPSIHYVKRLVGLPSEEVVMKDGAIWINGVKQDPPAEIAKLTFDADPAITMEGWGSPERPMQLGAGDYFVVGDFGQRSADSRMWGSIPRKEIEGVVTVIYWPFSRWRLFR
jgi:signal peptidase I